MDDRKGDDAEAETDEIARRLLQPLADEAAAPPRETVRGILRRVRGWLLIRDATDLATGAVARVLSSLLPRRRDDAKDDSCGPTS